jgi:hypothetical protein
MSDWRCRRCRDGVYFDETSNRYVICDCPAGESKRRWLGMTPEQRRQDRRNSRRTKKRDKHQGQDPIPF